MSQCIWHFLAIIYNQLLEYVQKAHRPSYRIHLGNKPTLANKIQAGPAHTLFAHQLRAHRSNTHTLLFASNPTSFSLFALFFFYLRLCHISRIVIHHDSAIFQVFWHLAEAEAEKEAAARGLSRG